MLGYYGNLSYLSGSTTQGAAEGWKFRVPWMREEVYLRFRCSGCQLLEAVLREGSLRFDWMVAR